MAGDNTVVIKRIKKSGGHGHHGGAWKVAYADFVTAMMAFFLLMWLINTTTPEQKRGIADYFAPQSIAQTVSGSGGVLGGRVMGEDSAHAGGAQSVMQKQSPPSPDSQTKAMAAGSAEGGANAAPSTSIAIPTVFSMIHTPLHKNPKDHSTPAAVTTTLKPP